jgi:hypothetical protein
MVHGINLEVSKRVSRCRESYVMAWPFSARDGRLRGGSESDAMLYSNAVALAAKLEATDLVHLGE